MPSLEVHLAHHTDEGRDSNLKRRWLVSPLQRKCLVYNQIFLLLGWERICKDYSWLDGSIFIGNILLDLSKLRKIIGTMIFSIAIFSRELALILIFTPCIRISRSFIIKISFYILSLFFLFGFLFSILVCILDHHDSGGWSCYLHGGIRLT